MPTRFERVSLWSACGLEPQEPPNESGVWHTLRGNRPRPVMPTRFERVSLWSACGLEPQEPPDSSGV
ncbi:MAG: hypothetical protein M1140_14680 [Chloroflexi bacterium]|nr:hypothetical protein [Chloroflexota bacterium]